MAGWICLHRALLDWEWYSDINVTRLFIHCLLKANHKPGNWQGKAIPRGSFITGRSSMAKETGLTEQQIRTAITKLKSTNEITITSTNKNSLVTLINYGLYQDAGQSSTSKTTDKSTNEQPTNNQPSTTNNNNNNNNKLSESKIPVCQHEKIIEIYHEVLPELPKVIPHLWGGVRKKNLNARWKEYPKHQELDFWRWYFGLVRKSSFHMGENDRGWQADLGWLVNQTNLAKILGKFS